MSTQHPDALDTYQFVIKRIIDTFLAFENPTLNAPAFVTAILQDLSTRLERHGRAQIGSADPIAKSRASRA